MKKNSYRILFAAVCGLMLWGLTACEPSEPKIPDSFPKKHLIEEFTGQDCGYCPYGMDCVHDFMGNDANWIVILHHYGYQADHFSVSGSAKITSKLGVNGAPTITIDRAATKTEDGKQTCFHPGYLPTVDKAQFETTTYASIQIENTYNASTDALKIHVSGALCKADAPKLKLTVLIKESGMKDYQADYYGSYEGWTEFRHANAVREFVTEPMGEELEIGADRRYSVYYDIYLDDKWVPENCAVVAFLSEDFNPVVQAEWAPVVDGTKGGSDILHGGITPVPVPDYYPEPGSDIAPKNYSGKDADTLTVAQAYYTPYSEYGFNYWQIMTYNSAKTFYVGNTSSMPFAYLYLFTSLDDKAIPVGTYQLDTTMAVGTAYAGFRDDEHMLIDGSTFYYISKSYFSQGYLVPAAQWLIVDGTLEITSSGWELIGHTRNGADIHLFSSKPITNKGLSSAPKKAKATEGAPQKCLIEYNKRLW